MAERIWKVTRRYRVEDTVWVVARSATEARQKVDDGDYDEVSEAETISGPRYPKATPIGERKG